MADIFSVLGLFLMFYIQGGQCYETCYNRWRYETYECDHGCCGHWNDYDYGCCTSSGGIIGGVIGGLIFVGIVVFVIVFCCVKKGSIGGMFSSSGRRQVNVGPSNNVTVVHSAPQQQPMHQPYGNQGGMQMGQAYPGPPQGPQGYGMMPPPPQQYPPPPPQQYNPAYPPKY